MYFRKHIQTLDKLKEDFVRPMWYNGQSRKIIYSRNKDVPRKNEEIHINKRRFPWSKNRVIDLN